MESKMKLTDMREEEVVGFMDRGETWVFPVRELHYITKGTFIKNGESVLFKARPCSCGIDKEDLDFLLDESKAAMVYPEIGRTELAPGLVDRMVEALERITLEAGIWYELDMESPVDIEGFEFKKLPIEYDEALELMHSGRKFESQYATLSSYIAGEHDPLFESGTRLYVTRRKSGVVEVEKNEPPRWYFDEGGFELIEE